VKGGGLGESPDLDSRDMAGLKAGDHQALERLYQRYARRLTGFFWRLGKRGDEVDDLVHEAFVRLWRHGRGWRGEGKLSTYIFGIAKSAWLDSRTRKHRELRAEDFPRNATPARPDLEMERRELRERIEAAVAELAEPLRLVFSMATAGGLKYREIAELLAIPIGTVKSRMAAAEEKLRASLAGYLGMKRETL
jgi:RNA polymerase sigma-70 factor, ECF subfamily